MISLPRKLFHAIEAVLILSYRTTAEPLSGKQLCELLGLPTRYLEAMMQQLVRARILHSVRGPSGGYVLAKAPELISLTDISVALRDEEELPESKTELGQQILFDVIESLQAHCLRYLDNVTLATLAERATRAGIPRAGIQIMDFTI